MHGILFASGPAESATGRRRRKEISYLPETERAVVGAGTPPRPERPSEGAPRWMGVRLFRGFEETVSRVLVMGVIRAGDIWECVSGLEGKVILVEVVLTNFPRNRKQETAYFRRESD